jgi:hypothetical protein
VDIELKDYLLVVWHRLWLVVLVAGLAAGATVTLVLRAPTEYQAKATVAVPSVVGGDTGPFSGTSGTASFVADFTAAAESNAVLRTVADQTKVPLSTIQAGLSPAAVTAVGQSGLVSLSYLTTKRASATSVAQGVAAETLTFLFKPLVARAQADVDRAAKTVADAQGAIDAFVTQTGLVDPARSYDLKATQISNLETQAVQSTAQGQAPAGTAIASALAPLQKDLATLTPLVAQYNRLADTKQRALTELDNAQAKLQTALDHFPADETSSAVSMTGPTPVSPVGDALRKGVVAAAAAGFLMVLFLFAVESPTRRHRLDLRIPPSPQAPPSAAPNGSTPVGVPAGR